MSAVSSASCGLSTHTSCQPRSRTASASLCSTPNAPGSSSARLPTMATIGIRSAGVTVSASIAYIQPTPLLPQNTRAPHADACFTISNCECSPSATMYSQSNSPLATSLATYCITVSYGLIAYAVTTSTSASLHATAIASLPVMSAVSSAFCSCFIPVPTVAMAILLPGPSGPAGDVQHFGNLLFVLASIPETVRALLAVFDLSLEPLLVAGFVFALHFPLACVVAESRLVLHRDAIFHGTYRLAHAAAAAGLH